MKIVNFALAFAASLCIFTSCSNEADEIVDVNKDVKVKKVFGVGTQIAQSRTAIKNTWDGNDAATVYWEETDKVTVFAEGHAVGDTFGFANWDPNENHNIASFGGYTYNSDNYYILHPAQSGARLVGDKVKLNIPNKQKAVKGSFDSNANILLGKATDIDTKTDLRDVCAYFSIKVPASCENIKITATNPEWHLAGTVTVEEISSAGNHICAFESDCTNEIELSGFTGEGIYLVSFIPTTGMNSDLEVTMNKGADGVVDLQIDRPESAKFSFSAGTYYKLDLSAF